MKYTQEQQKQILSKLNAGVIGKRKDWNWDRIVINQKWNKNTVTEIAKKYNTLGDFEKNHSGAYQYAQRHNFLDEITSNLAKKTFWNKDNALKAAKLYKTRTMFAKSKDKGAYRFLKKNNLLHKHFSKKHVNEVSKKTHYKLAKTCKTRSEFNSKKTSYYQKALKEGWLDEWFPKK